MEAPDPRLYYEGRGPVGRPCRQFRLEKNQIVGYVSHETGITGGTVVGAVKREKLEEREQRVSVTLTMNE